MGYRLLEKAALKAEKAAQPTLTRQVKAKRRKRPKPSAPYMSPTEIEEQARIDALARRLDAIKKRQKD